MFNFLHNWEAVSVLGKIGNFEIHYYGLMISLAIISAYFIADYFKNKYKLNINLDVLLLYLFLGALIGGRLYYVFYAWPFYKDNLLDIFKIWEGGLALHGDILGAFLALYLFSKKYKIAMSKLLNILVPAIPLAQSIGRWGNYFNQELFGSPSNLPWSIPIKESLRPEIYKNFQYFHPTFLYESILDFFLFIFLFFLAKKNLNKKFLDDGVILAIYIFFYSIIRFMIEFLRQDYSPYILGMRWFQLMSLVLIIISGIYLLYYFYKKNNAKNIKE